MTTRRRSAVRRYLPAALALALLTGCGIAEEKKSVEPAHDPVAPTTLILVRHAEKGSEERDPELTADGHRRAEALASMLADVELSAIYATKYTRNRQTAAPTAKRQELTVTEYSADQQPSAFLGGLLQQHRGGTVLVVGHSNTIPGMIAALTGEPETAHLDSYDDFVVVTFAELGRATVVPLSYPCLTNR